MQTALAEMDHKQPPTPVATDNTAADSIVNGMAKKKIHSNRHEILLGTRQNMKKHFHIFWDEGKKNLADYFTKHHPIWNHRTMIPR